MYHRTGRALVVTALVAASAGAALVASSATAAPVKGATTAAKPTADRSIFGRHSLDLRASGSAKAGGLLRAAAAAPAPANPGLPYPYTATTLTNGVVGPLQIAVGPRGRVYVADGFVGVLTRLGDKAPLFQAPKNHSVGGIDVRPDGSYAFTWGNQPAGKGYLTIRPAKGRSVTVDLGAYEKKYNPDAKNNYGAQSTDPCVIAAFTDPEGPPARYNGLVDTNPYAVASVRGGWVVADAGGNDLLFVSDKGKISTLAVLPPVPVVITKEIAAAIKLPDCTVGVTYNFEPVPTDVELGKRNTLYVTSLAGGPEIPGILPPTGSVWTLTTAGRSLTRLAKGFSLATNVAVTPTGRVLVAELGAGRVSLASKGKPVPLFPLPGVASLEAYGNSLYAGTLADVDEETGELKAPGSVVRIDLRF